MQSRNFLCLPCPPVRSYVRREGRITAAQQRALATIAKRYLIPAGDDPLVFDAVFKRSAPRLLEIGCGAGETLVFLAENHPENDYIGVEVYRPALGRLLQAIHSRTLNNVRLFADDVVWVLSHRIPERTLEAVYLFFPDPWPKRKHHRRRLLQPGVVEILQNALSEQGRLFIATDWDDYAVHIQKVIAQGTGLSNLAGDAVYAPRPRWRPLTRYESRARKLGHNIREFVYAVCTEGDASSRDA
ncbi:MAG: tRNA (guanosine(46)-N7)-methyltransferase TrmB [Gammaproteobacteria bacterium]